MLIAQDDELIVYIGYGLEVSYDFRNDDNTPVELNTTENIYSVVIRNVDEEFAAEPPTTLSGKANVDIDLGGRLNIVLDGVDTNYFKIPSYEKRPYEVSKAYSKILVVDTSTNIPLLDINVKPVKV